jgi:hypothetical protein
MTESPFDHLLRAIPLFNYKSCLESLEVKHILRIEDLPCSVQSADQRLTRKSLPELDASGWTNLQS